MRKIILDMDGVIVSTAKISHYPRYLILTVILFFHWLFLFFPSRLSRDFFQKHRVFVVSKRPAFCKWTTILWFKLRRYPVEAVHCIGLDGCKKELAEQIDPDVIIDDHMYRNYGMKKFYFKEEEA